MPVNVLTPSKRTEHFWSVRRSRRAHIDSISRGPSAAVLILHVGPALGRQAPPRVRPARSGTNRRRRSGSWPTRYYVGPRGLSAILVTSAQGHVLIDAALPESATAIASSVRALGFEVEDIRLILNSHVHFDHGGGIAELQRMSGATVAATPWSATVLSSGKVPPSDPQFGVAPLIAPVKAVRTVKDGETLRVGPLAFTAHETPGHTPGGTCWTCARAKARLALISSTRTA